jgi:hypothetical protein
MKYVLLAVLSLSLSNAALGQGHSIQYSPPGGYGNVPFPGPGRVSSMPPGGITGPHFPQLPTPPRRSTGPQPSLVIVPWPVYDSSYIADHLGNDQQEDLGQSSVTGSSPAPPVLINQSLGPTPEFLQPGTPNSKDGAQAFVNAQCKEIRPKTADEGRPTIYLLAFKDHRIVQAFGYWMEVGTLHYVSVEYGLNQVSLNLIDRDLSQRLNGERGTAFNLPAAK